MKQILLLVCILLAISATAFEFPENVRKLLEHRQQLAQSITFLVAFLAGILTFTSPCGFVILPTFFAYIFKERRRALRMTFMFSAGLILAFVLFGIIAGIVGEVFNPYKSFFAAASGIVLAGFGVMLIFNLGFSFLDFRVKHKPDSSRSSFLLGFFLAAGWTPCMGAVLGSIFVLAANTSSILKSTILFAAYAMGVSIPLMLASYFSDRYDLAKWFVSKHRQFSFFGRKIHTHTYNIVAGVVLIIIGTIMFAGNGTGFFMDTIPRYLPWTMEWFVGANQWLVEAEFLRSKAAILITIVVVVAAVAYLVKEKSSS